MRKIGLIAVGAAISLLVFVGIACKPYPGREPAHDTLTGPEIRTCYAYYYWKGSTSMSPGGVQSVPHFEKLCERLPK